MTHNSVGGQVIGSIPILPQQVKQDKVSHFSATLSNQLQLKMLPFYIQFTPYLTITLCHVFTEQLFFPLCILPYLNLFAVPCHPGLARHHTPPLRVISLFVL